MNQNHLLRKIALYLALSPQAKENKLLIDSLEKGYCFGFSGCHAAMDIMGKLTWWEAALVSIGNWDEKKRSLNINVQLPQQIDPKKDVKLRDIFERAIYYILLLQGNTWVFNKKGIEKEVTHQHTFFSPKNKYFEMLVNDEIRTPTHQSLIAQGCFEPGQRDTLLGIKPEWMDATNSICLAQNTSHCIRIASREGAWIVYDPNYALRTEKFFKVFTTPKALWKEVTHILGNAIMVQRIAIFPHDQHVDAIEKYAKEAALITPALIKEKGLMLIAQFSPLSLIDFINKIFSSQNTKDHQILADALAERDEIGVTALHFIASYAPKILSKLLTLIMHTSQEGQQKIAETLNKKDGHGEVALGIMAFTAPDAIPKLFKLAANTPNAPKKLANIIDSSRKKNGWTILQLIARYTPDALPKLLELIALTPLGPSKLAHAVAKTNKNRWSGLHMVAEYAPKALPRLLEIISTAPNSAEALSKALTTVNRDGESGLQFIKNYCPTALKYALTIKKTANSKKDLTRFVSSEIDRLYLKDNIRYCNRIIALQDKLEELQNMTEDDLDQLTEIKKEVREITTITQEYARFSLFEIKTKSTRFFDLYFDCNNVVDDAPTMGLD